MKKTLLVRTILVSSLILGYEVVFSDNTVNASEIRKGISEDDNIVNNKIRFIDQEGYYILDFNGLDHQYLNVKGKMGEIINLESIVPRGYDLADKKINLKFEKNDSFLDIKVKTQDTEYKVNFVEVNTGNIISSFVIKGLVGEHKRFPFESVPDGYVLENKWEAMRGISLNPDKKSGDFEVIKANRPDISVVTIKFIDKDSNIIEQRNISGLVGSKYVFGEDLPFNYILESNQPSEFIFKKDLKEIKVKLKRNTISNTIVFKDENGKKIGKKIIEGNLGEMHDVSNNIPYGYSFIDFRDSLVELKKDGSITEIVIKNNRVKNVLEFKDTNGKIFYTKEVEGTLGDSEEIVFHLKREYYLLDTQKDTFEFKKDGTVIPVIVDKNITNKIKYVDESGKEIKEGGMQQTIYGKQGNIIEIDIPDGYVAIDSKKIRINSEDGFEHIIKLKGMEKEFNLNFINPRNQEKIISKAITKGIVGHKIPVELIPQGYGIKYEQTFYNQYEISVWVWEKITTKINYLDPNGHIVNSHQEAGLDKDTIKLNVPKGYILVNNASGTLTGDINIPIQNVLVVPINGNLEESNKVLTQINFVDKNTNRTIHSYTVLGKHGESVNIQKPDEYEFSISSASKLVLDKSKKSVNIYVSKKQTENETTKYSSTITTINSSNYLYDNNGKQVKNRSLGKNTSWVVDKKMVINGVTYYRVATNEWVKASDVEEYAIVNATITTTNGDAKVLYTTAGKAVKNRALSGNSSWFSDRAATINGEKMYRVATNEWVKASDIK